MQRREVERISSIQNIMYPNPSSSSSSNSSSLVSHNNNSIIDGEEDSIEPGSVIDRRHQEQRQWLGMNNISPLASPVFPQHHHFPIPSTTILQSKATATGFNGNSDNQNHYESIPVAPFPSCLSSLLVSAIGPNTIKPVLILLGGQSRWKILAEDLNMDEYVTGIESNNDNTTLQATEFLGVWQMTKTDYVVKLREICIKHKWFFLVDKLDEACRAYAKQKGLQISSEYHNNNSSLENTVPQSQLAAGVNMSGITPANVNPQLNFHSSSVHDDRQPVSNFVVGHAPNRQTTAIPNQHSTYMMSTQFTQHTQTLHFIQPQSGLDPNIQAVPQSSMSNILSSQHHHVSSSSSYPRPLSANLINNPVSQFQLNHAQPAPGAHNGPIHQAPIANNRPVPVNPTEALGE